MAGLIDLNGKIFGKLTVISGHKIVNKRTHWYCLCECGNKLFVEAHNLKSGNTKSCGCYKGDVGINFYVHGKYNHPLYKIWQGIKTRCYNVNNKSFIYYGAKGVVMFDTWLKDPVSFIDWAIKNGWENGLQIDRYPNNQGNYEPENCRWATPSENSNNKKNNVLLLYKGIMYKTKELEMIGKVSAKQILKRIRWNKWSVEKAVETPGKKNQYG